MPLSDAQKRAIKNAREDEYTQAITIWEESRTEDNANDAYSRVTITSSSRTFSGAVSWGAIYNRNESEGGQTILGDVTLVCKETYRDDFEKEHVYVVISEERVVVKEINNILDTDEIIIFCQRSK